MLGGLFRRRRSYAQVTDLVYGRLMTAARNPAFYESLGMPDTLDGRFDMVVIHMALVLRRLSSVTPDAAPDKTAPTAQLAQALFDLMFRDMDRTLREIGVSDLKVGKEVKKMVRAYYGRALAYETGLKSGSLDKALRENAYRAVVDPDPAQVAALAAYMRRVADHLAGLTEERLLAGDITFPPVIEEPVDSVVSASPSSPAPGAAG